MNQKLPSAMLLAALFLTIFLSGCVYEKTIKQEFAVQIDKTVEDFSYKVEIYPTSAKPGEEVKIRFLFQPKKDLENFKIKFFDTCIFTAEKYEKEISLKKGSPKIVTFSFIAGEAELPRTCTLGFEFSYEARYTKTQDVIVLSRSEYEQRSRENSLGEFMPESYEEESPLKISLSFSEAQPFEEGSEVSMYLQYSNAGSGSLEIEEIKIKVPENLETLSCDDYSGKKVLSLSKELKFYGSSAENSVCRFKTRASQPVDAKVMEIDGKYKYKLEDYITVEVDVR